ncbi:MAG: aminoacyl-tRNA hydrolase [Myxococcota bacterium]|nr:aminoacyl-tRNA hydrolase [Myxococcota bacterium]
MFAHFGRDFVRVRCGIGRPVHGDVTNFVLSGFGADEKPWLNDIVGAAADAVTTILEAGAKQAQKRFNGESFAPNTES